MPATVDHGLKPYSRTTTPNVQSANPAGTVNLVPRPTQQINVVSLDVGGHLANPLRRVSVKHDAMLSTDRTDRRDVVEGSDLVVRPHDGDENGVVSDRSANQVCRHDAI